MLISSNGDVKLVFIELKLKSCDNVTMVFLDEISGLEVANVQCPDDSGLLYMVFDVLPIETCTRLCSISANSCELQKSVIIGFTGVQLVVKRFFSELIVDPYKNFLWLSFFLVNFS
jgi:hypothetical protein